jgi:hypothetical protein
MNATSTPFGVIMLKAGEDGAKQHSDAVFL